MKLYILGISYSMHDSSVCLLQDGNILSAIEEERMDRVKHSENFPYKSLSCILNKYHISMDDISYIGLNFRPSIVKKEKLEKFALEDYPNNYMLYYGMKMWYLTLEQSREILTKELGYNGKIIFVDHHMAHAANAFYSSDFSKALIVTSDGTGEKMSIGVWKGENNKIEKVISNSYPNSLGLIYTFFTYHVGLGLMGEGKMMGLAPYGKDTYHNFFDDLIKFTDDEIFKLNKKYFNIPFGMLYVNRCFTKEAIDVIGEADLSEEITENKKNIAASLQAFLERTMIRIVKEYLDKTHMKKLCLSGGVALNSALNGKLSGCVDSESLFVHPAPNDSGTSIGVCQYIYYSILNNKRNIKEFSPYLGTEYSEEQIIYALKSSNCTYKKFDNIEQVTAKLLNEGKIIGWFQGRMEIGPRALGNRSILADARIAGMKDLLNKKVKHREQFRPFAPVVKEEEMEKYFELKGKSPYMSMVAGVRDDQAANIPAVVHVDHTARVQSVNERQNKRLYHLLCEFEKMTTIPILINTSFNDNNEPIVCTPSDAIKCFLKTGIDYLVLDNYLVEKDAAENIQCEVLNEKDEHVENDNIYKYKFEYYYKGLVSKMRKKSIYDEDIYYEE